MVVALARSVFTDKCGVTRDDSGEQENHSGSLFDICSFLFLQYLVLGPRVSVTNVSEEPQAFRRRKQKIGTFCVFLAENDSQIVFGGKTNVLVFHLSIACCCFLQ